MISNCGHDERGKYSGGAAGDQTGITDRGNASSGIRTKRFGA